MEVQYIACSMAITYAIWIGRFIEELKLDLLNKLIIVFCDNKFVISLIKGGANIFKGKHIDISYHYIQDIVENEK